jgi:hypothetical protein
MIDGTELAILGADDGHIRLDLRAVDHDLPPWGIMDSGLQAMFPGRVHLPCQK